MKRTSLLWTLGGLVVASLIAVSAIAQTGPRSGAQQGMAGGMMGPGMTGGMMGPGMMGSGMMGHMMGPGMTGGMMGPGMTGGMMCSGMAGGMMGTSMMLFHRLQALGLSADQWRQIEQVRLNTQKELIPKYAKIRVAQLELWELFRATRPDEGKIRKKIDEINDLRAQVETAWVNALLQARQVLTEEQLQRLFTPGWPATSTPGGMMHGGMMGQ